MRMCAGSIVNGSGSNNTLISHLMFTLKCACISVVGVLNNYKNNKRSRDYSLNSWTQVSQDDVRKIVMMFSNSRSPGFYGKPVHLPIKGHCAASGDVSNRVPVHWDLPTCCTIIEQSASLHQKELKYDEFTKRGNGGLSQIRSTQF